MAFVRSKSPVILVAVALLVAVPLIGFTTYAIEPGPPPVFGGKALWIATAGALIGFVAGIAMVMSLPGRGRPLSDSTTRVLSVSTMALWVGIVVAISGFVGQWRPAYGALDISLNAAWAVLWLPPGVRRVRSGESFEVAAPRDRVYEFLSRPANQALYDEDVVSVTTEPPGELAAGSRIVVVRRYDPGVRGPRMLPGTIETAAVVRELVPGTRISTARDSTTSTFELSDTPAGTRVSTSASITVPYRLAFLGAVVGLAWIRRRDRAKRQRSLARLKELLEQP